MTVAILVFQLCMTVKDHQRTLTFQITYKLRYSQIQVGYSPAYEYNLDITMILAIPTRLKTL